MTFPPDIVASFTCPHPKVVFDRLLSGPKGNGKAIWSWRTEISPVDLYCYLGGRFGRPNGPQNFFRNDTSDNLIHWEWVLDFPQGHIHIYGMNLRTEVLFNGDIDVTDEDGVQLANLIKADFKNFGKQMSEVRQHLEKWTEFVNPYHRIRHAIEKIQSELDALNLRPETETFPDPFADPHFDQAGWEELSSRYSKGLGLCFGIRSMLPVLAEAYVNLILFILMRPELKSDDRLRENTIRQPIDIRVKSLHLTCVGFERPVDYSSPECKAYHTMVNERNDLLHGNVVLDKLRFNEVYFHGTVPVFKDYRGIWERSFGVDIEAVGLSRLAAEIDTIENFIGYLTRQMKPEIKEQVDLIAEKRDLGWNNKTGRVGLLFSGCIVDAHLGSKRNQPPSDVPDA